MNSHMLDIAGEVDLIKINDNDHSLCDGKCLWLDWYYDRCYLYDSYNGIRCPECIQDENRYKLRGQIKFKQWECGIMAGYMTITNTNGKRMRINTDYICGYGRGIADMGKNTEATYIGLVNGDGTWTDSPPTEIDKLLKSTGISFINPTE